MESPILPLYRLKIYKLRTFILILIFSTITAAFSFPERDQELTVQVVDYVIKNQYNSALGAIQTFQAQDGDPLPSLLKLAVFGMRDVDFEQIIDSTEFLSCYDSASAILVAWEQTNGVTSYTRTLSGLCKAIYSAYYIRQKKYIAAMRNGFDALDHLREAQQMDSTNYEVDFFLGLYEYARAELRSRLWWVLFWYPGSREKGIERVKRCSTRALLTGEAAKLSLCDMYIQEKRNEEAKQVLGELKKRYPESRFVLWAEVKYFEAENNFSAAAATYAKLAMLYKKEKFGEFNAFSTSFMQANMLYKSGDTNSSKELCNNILQKRNINAYRDLKKETGKLLERCNAVKN